VDLRAGLDEVEKKKVLPYRDSELQPLGRPPSSQSLNRLSYPGSLLLLLLFRAVKVAHYIGGGTTSVREIWGSTRRGTI
jgi:hypothetical protein